MFHTSFDPNKLMEIWAENNESTPESICKKIGTTPEELYYNFGYTSNSINYAKDHKSGKVSYSDIENEIFGEDNGEDRSIVFGTHFLYIDTAGKYKVTYESENDNFTVRQRDILKATSDVSHNYSDYGYKSKVFRNKLEVDEETAPMVRKIFELAAYEGYGIMRIADYLYENKVLSPLALKSIREGKEPGENPYGWCKSTISNLLNNDVYLGKIIYGKTRKVNFKSKKVVKTDKSE